MDFIDAALDDLAAAEQMLIADPGIGSADLFAALVTGNSAFVERAIADSPATATAKGGPRQWEPLLYVCFSRFAAARSQRAGDLTATARLLLAHGADPNGFHIDPRWPEWPMPCLYGASGLNNNAALTAVLLDAGARPDDGESLYHSTEHPDLASFRVLLERAAPEGATKVLNHTLDSENAEGVRLLLAHGADLNHVNQRGETSLHWAVWRGRSAAIVALLLDAGANIDARRRSDSRTAYAIAVQSGQTAAAELLASRGADTAISDIDRFVGECARLLAAAPALPEEYSRLLPDLAANHRTSAVRALLALGVDVNARGEEGGTALHWACWKGYADLVKLLLAHGASLTIEDTTFQGTPAGWCEHGRVNCREGDYEETARLLREAAVGRA